MNKHTEVNQKELNIEARKQASAFGSMLVTGVKFDGFRAVAESINSLKNNLESQDVFVEHCEQIFLCMDLDDNKIITSFKLA